MTSGRAFVAKSSSRPSGAGTPEEGVAHRAAHEEALVAGVDEPARDLLRGRRQGRAAAADARERWSSVPFSPLGGEPRRNPFPSRASAVSTTRRDHSATVAAMRMRCSRVGCGGHAVASFCFDGRAALGVARPARPRPRGGRRGALRPSRRHAHAAEGLAPPGPPHPDPEPLGRPADRRRHSPPAAPDGRGPGAEPRTRRGPGARPGAAHRSAAVPDRGRRPAPRRPSRATSRRPTRPTSTSSSTRAHRCWRARSPPPAQGRSTTRTSSSPPRPALAGLHVDAVRERVARLVLRLGRRSLCRRPDGSGATG